MATTRRRNRTLATTTPQYRMSHLEQLALHATILGVALTVLIAWLVG